MEIFAFRHVTYSYPGQKKKALDDISFSVKRGAFILICGRSGCGKTTLLRHLKTCLKPQGLFSGEILFNGSSLSDIDERTQAEKIGFVFQSPDNQTVTDKVWRELAFGLESLGADTPSIRRKVAETASFFGIESWFHKDVNELSGGQRQILSLASVMAMQPEVLALDEPTALLDPIAASEFLSVLEKINRELGITVILTEHRLEETFPLADSVLVMEDGKIICSGAPAEAGEKLKAAKSPMTFALPAAMQIWAGVKGMRPCPVSVRDGSEFLTNFAEKNTLLPKSESDIPSLSEEKALEAEDIWFRYEKDAPDIISGMNFYLKKGEFYALLGGNGTGKTTTLKIFSGLLKAYRGNIRANGKIALLPQDPEVLFVKKTIREDLYDAINGKKNKNEADKKIARVVDFLELTDFLDSHPYDISEGEKQRAATAKILLTEPDILLLDEPTKGLDAAFKVNFADILNKLLSSGISILAVSHDIVFCAEYARRCGLFFDGKIAAEGTPSEFFSGNNFYTTPANRIARRLIPDAVTVSDVIRCCGGKTEEKPLRSAVSTQHRATEKDIGGIKIKKLSLRRKIIAGICAFAALAVFFYAISISDLTEIINENGSTPLSPRQLILYAVLILSMLGLIFSLGGRNASAIKIQTLKEKKKPDKRTVFASIIILTLIPLTVLAGVFFQNGRSYNIAALAVLAEAMLPFVLIFEGKKPKARELTLIASLCAIGAAGRAAFFMLPQFKPIIALAVISGVALGGETGFLTGSVTMLVSNMLFSQGPWTPWQMFCTGIIGFLAGVLSKKGLLRPTRLSLAVFGAAAAIIIYGGIMNIASALMFSPSSFGIKMVSTFYLTGLPMDLVHSAATFTFLMASSEPILRTLERIKLKYGL